MAHLKDSSASGRVIRPWEGEDAVLRLERAAVRRLHGHDAHVERSLIGAASAERMTLKRGTTVFVAGQSVAMDEARVGILVAPVVRGDVRTLVDMRSAFAMGLGIVLGRLLLSWGRALSRR